jgi:hypothetical protein
MKLLIAYRPSQWLRWLIPCLLMLGATRMSGITACHTTSHSICPTDSLWRNAPVFSNLDTALAANALGVPVLRLDLSRQKIRVIPSELAQLSELKQLILDRTKIDALPSALVALRDLEHFSADMNQMTQFPEVILEWKQLGYLSLGDNLIDSIPLNIDVLDRLQTLNLWSNLIAFFPASLGDLMSLSTLDLTNNDMTAEEQYQLKTWMNSSVELLLSTPCRCEFDD